MSETEKIERYKNTDFKCPNCSNKLDIISQEPSRRLDYICPNEDCQTEVFFDKFEDQWYVRQNTKISEPEVWKP